MPSPPVSVFLNQSQMGKKKIRFKSAGDKGICGVDYVLIFVWRELLVSAANQPEIADDVILRMIKDAHDYGWR